MFTRNLRKSAGSSQGFTLIEVIIIIVVLGILATVSLAKYQDVTQEAKSSACKSALGGLRGGITTWYAKQIASNLPVSWPPIDTLRRVGAVVVNQIPPNPFQTTDHAPDSIVTGVTRGVTVGTRGGWAYNPSTGEIWANTNTSLAGSGCGGPTTIGENSW